ncbi:hypothetical protein D3C81_2029720 [compost metagenome]
MLEQRFAQQQHQGNQLDDAAAEQGFHVAAVGVADIAPARNERIGVGTGPKGAEAVALEPLLVDKGRKQLPDQRTVRQ